jgi:hypothetical protein
MAEALLKAWNAPAVVSEVEIDAATGAAHPTNAKIVNVKTGPQISWAETESALPMPIDPRDKLLDFALKSSDFIDTLDRENLRVKGLTAPTYELKIDGVSVGRFSSDDLTKGVNLATLNTPMLHQSLDVHALTLKHNNMHFAKWRTVETGLTNDASPATKLDAMEALDRLDNELVAEQRAAAQPKPHFFELTPVQ